MKYKNVILAVKNLNSSRYLFETVLGQSVSKEGEDCVQFSSGIKLVKNDFASFNSGGMELYFEENKLEAFVEKLESSGANFTYSQRLGINENNQLFVRIIDENNHLIEISETIDYAKKKEKKQVNADAIKIEAKRAKAELEKRYAQALELLADEKKIDDFLIKVEELVKQIPKGSIFAPYVKDVRLLILMVRSYISGEYKDIPVTTIVAAVSALVYVLSPLDVIPDNIPVVGFADDAAVVAYLMKSIEKDIKKYEDWRKKNK